MLAKFELRNERVRTELLSSDLELGDDDDDDDSRLDNRPTEPEQKGEEFEPWFESSPLSWPDRRDRHYDPRVHGPRHVIHGTGSNQDDEYTAFVYLADGDNYVYRAAMLTAHFLPLLHHYMYVKALVQVRTSPTSKGVKSTKKNGMTATGK